MERTFTPEGSSAALPRTSPEVLAACSEALQAIRTRNAGTQAIGVTSALRGEGRSTIAASLAIADVRRMGRRVVLLDLDFDRWQTAHYPTEADEAVLLRERLRVDVLSAHPRRGSSAAGHHHHGDAGDGSQPPRSALLCTTCTLSSGVWDLVDWFDPDLGVLRLGDRVDADRLTQDQVRCMLAELLNHDVDIVADLACLPPKGTGDQIAGLFDAIVLVVRAGATSADDVRRASLFLTEPPMVLLNRTTSAIPRWLRGGNR